METLVLFCATSLLLCLCRSSFVIMHVFSYTVQLYIREGRCYHPLPDFSLNVLLLQSYPDSGLVARFFLPRSQIPLSVRSSGILPLHVSPERCPRINAHEFEAAHPSPEVGQRHPICRLGRLHFGKEHRVGSARHFCGYAAFDGSQRVGQEGHTECSIRDAHTAELLRARTGEV